MSKAEKAMEQIEEMQIEQFMTSNQEEFTADDLYSFSEIATRDIMDIVGEYVYDLGSCGEISDKILNYFLDEIYQIDEVGSICKSDVVQ